MRRAKWWRPGAPLKKTWCCSTVTRAPASTAAIAVEAVGRENVTGVGMPGPFSSDHSVSDARDMAANLGIRFELVNISGVCESFERELEPLFRGLPRDVTEENLQ